MSEKKKVPATGHPFMQPADMKIHKNVITVTKDDIEFILFSWREWHTDAEGNAITVSPVVEQMFYYKMGVQFKIPPVVVEKMIHDKEFRAAYNRIREASFAT